MHYNMIYYSLNTSSDALESAYYDCSSAMKEALNDHKDLISCGVRLEINKYEVLYLLKSLIYKEREPKKEKRKVFLLKMYANHK